MYTVVAVGASPSSIADTLPRFEAVAMVAARFRYTLITVDTCPTLSTPAAHQHVTSLLPVPATEAVAFCYIDRIEEML